MAGVLLANFLNDPAEYEQAESLWREHWSNLIRELGQESIWESPWMNTTFNDGTPFRDGNPIFTAICPTRRLGVRVIQVELEKDPNELSTWTDFFAKGEPDEIKELVIHCVLSDETLRTATKLMKSWLTDGTAEQPRRAS
jgi:hypothetical protein